MTLPPELSFGEDEGIVEVCAMFFIAPGGTATANVISIELTTSDITTGRVIS